MFLFDIVQVLFQPSSEVLKDNTEYYRIPNFKIISSKKITTTKNARKIAIWYQNNFEKYFLSVPFQIWSYKTQDYRHRYNGIYRQSSGIKKV